MSYPWAPHERLNAADLNAAIAGVAGSLGLGSMATQAASAVAVTGGAINGVTVGAATPTTGSFTRIRGSGNLDQGGVASGITNNYLHVAGYTYGAGVADGSGYLSLNRIQINDQVNAGSTEVLGTLVQLNSGGAPTAGGRTALKASMQVVGIIAGGFGVGAGNYAPAVAFQAYSSTATNQGGAGGWPGFPTSPSVSSGTPYFRGSQFGAVSNVWLASGATNYGDIIGHEIDVAVFTGASTLRRIGLVFGVDGPNQGILEDSAMQFAALNTTAAGFSVGIEFGSKTQVNGTAATATLIRSTNRVYGIPGGSDGLFRATSGVDFREAIFTGVAFASPGFAVSGTGAVSQRPAASATPAANGDLVFELTSNTSLTVKAKGSDGVVRSAVLTLA